MPATRTTTTAATAAPSDAKTTRATQAHSTFYSNFLVRLDTESTTEYIFDKYGVCDVVIPEEERQQGEWIYNPNKWREDENGFCRGVN
jgi:hypothetical protein